MSERILYVYRHRVAFGLVFTHNGYEWVCTESAPLIRRFVQSREWERVRHWLGRNRYHYRWLDEPSGIF